MLPSWCGKDCTGYCPDCYEEEEEISNRTFSKCAICGHGMIVTETDMCPICGKQSWIEITERRGYGRRI